MVCTEKKQKPVSNENKYSNEAGALQKLIAASVIHETEETKGVGSCFPLKVPDNNPFKRRKFEEISLDQMGSQVSEGIEGLDTLYVSQSSVTMEGLDTQLEKDFCKKRKGNDGPNLCQTIIDDNEEASKLTKDENLDILCLNCQSQESVNSKSTKVVTDSKGNIKQNNSKSLERKSCSILNFFSRV